MRRTFVLLLLSLAASLAAPAALQARNITIRDYQSDVVVNRDGTTVVTETLRVYFEGSWNGIYRDLSLQHTTGQGRRAKLDVDVLGVTDGSGAALRWWKEKPEPGVRRIRIAVPGAADAERTVVIRYRVNNAVRFFFARDSVDEEDELYWNVTGNAWPFTIEHVRARFTVPEGALPTSHYAYTGSEGSKASDATVTTAGRTVTAEVTRPLEPEEGLTLAVAWPAGILPRPSRAELFARLLLPWWPLLLLPPLAFVVGWRHWSRYGRDPREQAIVVQYEPPDGMTPAEMGALVDGGADLRDVTSTLVDLAVRGFIAIEEIGKDWAFYRRAKSASGLVAHERAFLTALFSDATSVRLSSLANRFYSSVPAIEEAIHQRLLARGYYLRRPDGAQSAWVLRGVGVAIASFVASMLVPGEWFEWLGSFALLLGGVGAGAILLVFGTLMAARTEKGARAREASLGFREFLEQVESERYRRMITSPEMFERFLPYAMAFGVEGRWAKAFEDLYRQPPEWYAASGGHAFSATRFTTSMSSMRSQASSIFSSSPSSSSSGSSSGSSGGGSSGGGSGGGGGGGW